MNRRILAAALLAALAVRPALADNFGGFQQFADRDSLKPFARDLGGVLGSATFHSGRVLGFSGFDVGPRMGMLFYPSKGNKIMRNNGVKGFGMPWFQAEVGMPLRIDGFIRGASFEGLTVAGGGLRLGIFKGTDKPWSPHFLLSASAHSAVHQHFSATQVGHNWVLSSGLPRFVLFGGGGFDWTRLVARASALDPALAGATVTVFEPRGTVGLKVKPFDVDPQSKAWNWLNFFYLSGAYVYTHGQSGAEAALGLRF